MIARVMFMLTILSVALLMFATWYALDHPVSRFVVQGELSTAEQRMVREALAGADVGGVLSTDLDRVGAAVERLPWTRRVSVQRGWPDALVVTLDRARPVARWGETRYVSAAGQLLELPDEHRGLPQFDVQQNTPQQAMEVYRLLDQISARENLIVNRLSQNPQGEWTVHYADGLQVLLGAEQLNERMHRFLLVYRRVLADGARHAAYVDARYANGVAVKFHEEGSELLVANNESAEGA